jgi:hypothetical protein
MEKKRDTVIPADLKGLLVKWYVYVPLATKGLKCEHFKLCGVKTLYEI